MVRYTAKHLGMHQKYWCVENGKNFQWKYGSASGKALGRGGNALKIVVMRSLKAEDVPKSQNLPPNTKIYQLI